MASAQNFRSAFNGFNREDVVRYLEYLNTKHQNQINQLTAEAEELRAQLAQQPAEDQVEELKAQIAQLQEQLAQAQERCQALEAETKSSLPAEQAEELDTYRRAERMERMARERSELVYHQANGVLGEATARVDSAAAEITEMADQAMQQITRLQVAVSSSKQALQDAASLMNAIRPNPKTQPGGAFSPAAFPFCFGKLVCYGNWKTGLFPPFSMSGRGLPG